jgi:cell division protein FtsZ
MTLQEPGYELVSDKNKFKNIIKVIGVGGAGCNAVKHLHRLGFNDIGLMICNTDAQALDNAPSSLRRLQIGIELTKGLGAGTKSEMGKKAAEESKDSIEKVLRESTEMLFITAGMGGGTGTGAAPVIAEIARKLGILVVAIVTDAFSFEGKNKRTQAKKGIDELKQYCDTVLVIKNDRLETIYGNMEIEEAYAKADDVLANAVKSIAELITRPGIINLDFADVRTVLGGAGQAVMGIAEAEGEERAEIAIREALKSPLLENNDIKGATKILVSIAYSPECKIFMSDQNKVTKIIEETIGEENEADIFKHGFAIDESLGKKVRVTVVAAGFEDVFDLEIPINPPKIIEATMPKIEVASTPVSGTVLPNAKIHVVNIPTKIGEKEAVLPTNIQVVQTTTAQPVFFEDKKSDGEQIKQMIQGFVREGYKNPKLQQPSFARNGKPLYELNKVKQSGKSKTYELNQLLDLLISKY